ncbi:MAG: hypothetical protein ABIG03_01775 [Candidatus Eisenbacteria bacterium]
MRHTPLLVLAVAISMVMAQSPLRAEPADSVSTGVCAGVVVSVRGDVKVERDGSSEPVTEGLVLQDGDIVSAPDGARCTGFTPSGEPFDLPGPGELRLAITQAEGVIDRVSLWVRRQLTQWIGESRRQPIVTRTLMRDWEVETLTPAPIIPAPGGHVRPGASVFYWGSVPGIDSYTVTLVADDGKESSKIVRSHRLVIDDLVPGQEYVWKVQPSVDGWTGRSKWRSFRVMLSEEENSLDGALREMDDLEAGVLLLSAGLHDEAVYRLDAAVGSGSQAQSARRWRAQTMAEIGLYQEAYEDLVRSWGES